MKFAVHPAGAILRAVNWHDVIDERSLEMDRVIARELRANPARLGLVAQWIQRFLAKPDYPEHLKDALMEWMEIIHQGLPRVLEALADFTEEGRRRRQNSPFAVLMPQEERQRILKKYESYRTGASFAGVSGHDR